jgi:hypothetical protein
MTAARLVSIAAFAAVAACIPDSTTGSSGGTSGSSGGAVDGGEGGADEGGSSVDPTRAALCDAYAQATAQCCDAAPGTCPQTGTAVWKNHCIQYAASCPSMPTCFDASDCNTLMYCSGSC